MEASATDYNCYYSITHNDSQVNTDNEQGLRDRGAGQKLSTQGA